jgi:hypothetical protein
MFRKGEFRIVGSGPVNKGLGALQIYSVKSAAWSGSPQPVAGFGGVAKTSCKRRQKFSA